MCRCPGTNFINNLLGCQLDQLLLRADCNRTALCQGAVFYLTTKSEMLSKGSSFRLIVSGNVGV